MILTIIRYFLRIPLRRPAQIYNVAIARGIVLQVRFGRKIIPSNLQEESAGVVHTVVLVLLALKHSIVRGGTASVLLPMV